MGRKNAHKPRSQDGRNSEGGVRSTRGEGQQYHTTKEGIDGPLKYLKFIAADCSPVLRSHFSLIRAAIDPPSFAPSPFSSSFGDACSTAARMADSPPKASAFPFIVRSMLMNPLLRLVGKTKRFRFARRQQSTNPPYRTVPLRHGNTGEVTVIAY